MNLETLQRLFDYTYWAHRRVWGCVEQLSDAQYTRPLDYSIGSIHEQVVHMMSAEAVWINRMKGTPLGGMFDPADYPDRAAVRQKWDAVEQELRTFLAGMTDAQLSRTFSYTNLRGEPFTNRHDEILLHMVNHGTDHRAQILAMIHHMGGQTLEQDLVLFVRE